MPDRTVTIAGETRRVEPVSARKASRAFALLRHINARAKDLAQDVDRYAREWRDEHVTYLTRPEARVQYPERVVYDPLTGGPVKDPDTGNVVMQPSPVDSMSEADWEATGGRYPHHDQAPGWALAMYAFEGAVELAEAHVYRLLALLLMPNDEVAERRREGSLDDALDQAAEELLDSAMADEVLDLAVVAGDVLDEQFRSKVDALQSGGVGKLLRLAGMGPATTNGSAPTSGPTTSTPGSSTATPSSSEPVGDPTPSSTPTTGSSNGSVSLQTPTAPELERSETPSG